MQLMNETTKNTLIPDLEVASSTWTRMKGLLGREGLAPHEALWILRCNSVHTFFMKFAIDLVFLDGDLIVRKTCADVKPGRLVLPVWTASSVIEFPSGFLERNPIRVGDKLHVDPALS